MNIDVWEVIDAATKQFGFMNCVDLHGKALNSQDMLSSVRVADCVAIIPSHLGVDYNALVENNKLIVDTRNALKNFRMANISRL